MGKISLFQSQDLNEAGQQIISNYHKTVNHLQTAQKELNSALLRRWDSGRVVHENYDRIIDECGSQRAFSEKIGVTEAMLSNDLRGFRSLLDEGCETKEQVINYLQEKGISPVIRNWERLPRLLNEPQEYKERDTRQRDEKRLEQLASELEEIKNRNESENQNVIEPVSQMLKQTSDLKKHINKDNPFEGQWKCEGYLDFVRSLGKCFITGKPCKPDAHHTDPWGGSGATGGKLPDYLAIPVEHPLHQKIERGDYTPTFEELAHALIKTQSLFIRTHYE